MALYAAEVKRFADAFGGFPMEALDRAIMRHWKWTLFIYSSNYDGSLSGGGKDIKAALADGTILLPSQLYPDGVRRSTRKAGPTSQKRHPLLDFSIERWFKGRLRTVPGSGGGYDMTLDFADENKLKAFIAQCLLTQTHDGLSLDTFLRQRLAQLKHIAGYKYIDHHCSQSKHPLSGLEHSLESQALFYIKIRVLHFMGLDARVLHSSVTKRRYRKTPTSTSNGNYMEFLETLLGEELHGIMQRLDAEQDEANAAAAAPVPMDAEVAAVLCDAKPEVVDVKQEKNEFA